MKYLIFSFFAVIFSFGSYSQLDSINVTYSITEVPNLEDSLLSFENLEVQVWVNDFDFFGELIVDVINSETDYPISKIKLTKAQIEAENLLDSNGIISIGIEDLPAIFNLTIKVQVRNYQLVNLPQVIINHNN